MDNIKFNQKSVLRPQCFQNSCFCIVPNIFYFIKPFSLSLEFDVAPYANVKKGNMLDNNTKSF